MKLTISIFMFLFVASGYAIGPPYASDNMGAHVNFGRGCSVCHVPHTGSIATGSGAAQAPAMLWGEDVTSTYTASGGQSFEAAAKNPEQDGLLMCLSCHDGNYASKSMLKNTVYEALPSTYRAISAIPTLVDKAEISTGSDFSDHPVGVGAQVGCGLAINWACAQNNSVSTVQGAPLTRFAADYGIFIKPITYEGKSIVLCTTCHTPHSMNQTIVSKWNSSIAYAPGIYPTKYFLRAPYAPSSFSRTSNVAAQYCRQCHADLSNEMNGSTAMTTM